MCEPQSGGGGGDLLLLPLPGKWGGRAPPFPPCSYACVSVKSSTKVSHRRCCGYETVANPMVCHRDLARPPCRHDEQEVSFVIIQLLKKVNSHSSACINYTGLHRTNGTVLEPALPCLKVKYDCVSSYRWYMGEVRTI